MSKCDQVWVVIMQLKVYLFLKEYSLLIFCLFVQQCFRELRATVESRKDHWMSLSGVHVRWNLLCCGGWLDKKQLLLVPKDTQVVVAADVFQDLCGNFLIYGIPKSCDPH